MANPVIIPLKVEGAETAKDVLKSIKQSYLDLELFAVASADRASKKRLAGLKAEVDESKKLLKQLVAEERHSSGLGQRPRGATRSATTPSAAMGRGGDKGLGDFALDQFQGLKGIGEAFKVAGGIGVGIMAFKAGLDLAADALKQFGGFVLNDVIKPAMQLETTAQQVANASGGRISADEIQSKARAVALPNNLDPLKVVEAAGVFQDLTGESKLSFDIMKTIGMLAKGRGADVKTMASMAGTLWKEGMSEGELSKLLLMQTAQGDMGSIPLRELARLGGKVTAPAASFSGDYETQIAMSGALLNASRRGFTSTDTAATGVGSFVSDALKLGKLYDPKAIVKDASGAEQIANAPKLLASILGKTSGNLTELQSAKWSKPAQDFIKSFQARFTGEFAKAKGEGLSDPEARAKAAKAVEEFVKTFVSANTTFDKEAKGRDAVMKTSGEKWDAAMNKIKDKLLEIMPTIDKLIDDFAKAAPDIAEAALTIANAMMAVAKVIMAIMKPFQSTDDNAVGPGRRGKYEIDPETGKFVFKADSQRKGVDDFGTSMMKPIVLKEGQAGVLAGTAPQPANPAVVTPMAPLAPTGPVNVEAPSAKAAAGSTDELHSAAMEATKGLKDFKVTVEDLTAGLKGLNRTKPFSKQ